MRHCHIKAHSSKDSREKVGEGVASTGGREEHERKDPQLPIGNVLEKLLPCQGVGNGVCSISLNSFQNHFSFVFSQHLCLVWEINNGNVSNQSKNNSQKTFKEEDPSPSTETARPRKLGKSVGENRRETRGKDGKSVEEG